MRRNRFGYYLNPHQKKTYRGLIHYLLWQLGFYNDPIEREPVPKGFTFPNPREKVDPLLPRVTWINHSSYLVHCQGKNFLLDPIWNERCSPVPFLGPKRHHPPPCTLQDLQQVDYVILSHNHYDHMDKQTLCQLQILYPHIEWIVPCGLKRWMERTFPRTRGHIYELSWWQTCQVAGVNFTAVPAQHFSGRGLLDRNRSLWMGCVVEFLSGGLGIKRFYFAGDTGYNPIDFKKIGEQFGGVDLSLLPIGVYTPRAFMQPVHINPEESLRIHEETHSKLSVGGHFGTFKLSSDSLTRPPYDLFLALQKKGIPCHLFRVLHPGQTINW